MKFAISLTIDNGPEPEVTPWVLDVLRDRDVKATFFVVGSHAAEAPELVARAHDEGHWIGNHTWSHSVPLGLQGDVEEAEREISRTQEVLRPFAHERKFFRPFGQGGIKDRRLLRSESADYLVREGFTCVIWSVVPRDWADPEGWPETALEECAAREHSTLVVHDATHGSLRQLDRFITAVHERGGRFVQDIADEDIVIERGAARPRLEQYVTDYETGRGG